MFKFVFKLDILEVFVFYSSNFYARYSKIYKLLELLKPIQLEINHRVELARK